MKLVGIDSVDKYGNFFVVFNGTEEEVKNLMPMIGEEVTLGYTEKLMELLFLSEKKDREALPYNEHGESDYEGFLDSDEEEE